MARLLQLLYLGVHLVTGTHSPCDEGESSDSACFLSRRSDLSVRKDFLDYDFVEDEVDEPEESAYDIFMDSYAEIADFNKGMLYIKTAVVQLIGLIPYVGQFISFFVSIFWGPSGDHDKALIEAIQKWTERYVGKALTEEVHAQLTGIFMTMDSGLAAYQQCKSHVEESIEKGDLENQLSTCDSTLKILIENSEQAMNKVSGSKWRGRLIADYVMAATMKMSLWRERYDQAAFYTKNTSKVSTLFPNTTESMQSLKKQYDIIEDALASMVDQWKKWRWEEIEIQDTSYISLRRRAGMHCSRFKLVDYVKPQNDHEWSNIDCRNVKWYVDGPKMQDNLRHMHFRKVQFAEMVPMLKMFTGLHQLIPGQELQPLTRGKVLPQWLELGPFSAFLSGRTYLTPSNMNRRAYPNEVVPHVSGQRWSHLKVYKGSELDQLIFQAGLHTVLSYPSKRPGGDEEQRMTLPYDLCGLHLGYKLGMMQQWTTFEIKNLTKSWKGREDATGFVNTGAFVCGLYKFRQFSKIRSDAVTSGDAFTVAFEFLPGEAH